MRFDRYPKLEGHCWTRRMEVLHLRRQERAIEKVAQAYPLFSDQIEVPQVRSVEEEKAHRDRLLLLSEQRTRDLFARHWRGARREYFACAPHVRARIRDEWNRWTGPAKPVYLSYVIEKHNGVREEKSRQHREREVAMLVRIDAARAAQTTLL
jgi:hypothetical protein